MINEINIKDTQEKRNKLKTLLKKTIQLIKKGSRKDESLIMTNVSIIEYLEYQLNVPQENRFENKRIYRAFFYVR